MRFCDYEVRYGPVRIGFEGGNGPCTHWHYRVRPGERRNPQPLLIRSIVFPLCRDLTAVSNLGVTGLRSYRTRIGFDPVTRIYGLAIETGGPMNHDFSVGFDTPLRTPVPQLVGLVSEKGIFTNQCICSPGCDECERWEYNL